MRRSDFNNMSDEIIQTIDIANTLNGGVAQPTMGLTKFADHHQLELKVPGVSESNLHVKVVNNRLLVFYEHPIATRGVVLPIPRIAYDNLLPHFIDTENISAQFSAGTLWVHLPFNELPKGYQRDIPIES